MVFWSTVAILFFCLILVKAADHVVIAIRRLSGTGGGKAFALSAILLAIGTSFPEISVALTSALSNTPNISLGTTLGSNIVNMSLVAGLAAILVGTVHFGGTYLKKDIFVGLIAGTLPIILMFDGRLSRIDGLILLLVYATYVTSFFRVRMEQIAREQREESFVYRFFRRFNHISSKRRKELTRLLLSVSVMLFAANIVVRIANFVADQASVSRFITGLFIVAIGTSLPELAFSFRSLTDREPSMFVGNLVGSTVANSTLVVGIAATISPIEGIVLGKYFVAAGFFIGIYLAFWFLTHSKAKLERWESVLLIALYLLFVVLEFR